jgi:hypothetical protein
VRFAPLLVLAGVAIAASQPHVAPGCLVIDGAAIGPLLVVAIFAFSAWRGSRRR